MHKRFIYIGTSGWSYEDWKGRFYPQRLKEEQLVFYAREFDTVELNYSFYKLPSIENFKKWYEITPKKFLFSIKLSRYITHTKRLILDRAGKKAVRNFLSRAAALGEKYAVTLVLLPSQFAYNIQRLEEFIVYFKSIVVKNKMHTELAFEFRNVSWLQEHTYQLLNRYNCALVMSSSGEYPFATVVTADFVYIRFHGPASTYASSYSAHELQQWRRQIDEFPRGVKKVFAYFNNDVNAYAIENARYLKQLIWEKIK